MWMSSGRKQKLIVHVFPAPLSGVPTGGTCPPARNTRTLGRHKEKRKERRRKKKEGEKGERKNDNFGGPRQYIYNTK
jgi:hypothetical protein